MDPVEFALKERYPGMKLTQEQLECLNNIIKNKDVEANLPVGHGKSILFHLLPDIFRYLEKPHKAIVLAPLNAIVKDQLSRMRKLGINGIFIDMQGNMFYEDEEISIEDAVEKGEIYICHPEALLCCDVGNELLIHLKNKVGVICIDECHRVEDWGKEFRRTYSEIGSLKCFFPQVPFLCLSGTILKFQLTEMIKLLNLRPIVIKKSPDLPNTFLEVLKKDKGSSQDTYEEIFIREVGCLKDDVNNYPVTLLFLPLQYMSYAMRYACRILPDVCLTNAPFGAIFANQDAEVLNTILFDLKTDSPQYRLVFTTSVLGMGYDSPSVSRVIHAKPPRSLSNYLQEIGRAGRRGQQSIATLFFNMSDIASNLPGIDPDIVNYCLSDSCLRSNLLGVFGFGKSPDSPKGCKCCSICKKVCTCNLCK